jgi:hypothetical protein
MTSIERATSTSDAREQRRRAALDFASIPRARLKVLTDVSHDEGMSPRVLQRRPSRGGTGPDDEAGAILPGIGRWMHRPFPPGPLLHGAIGGAPGLTEREPMIEPARKIGSFTYRDYRRWPDEERWELIDGEAWDMCPAPTRPHQQMVVELTTQIHNFR